MPDVENHYIGVDILLPRGDPMVRCHVLTHSNDFNGNIVDRGHRNQILNTSMYEVEFAGGEDTELTTNIVSESLYTQFDAVKNEYLLLDLLVSNYKDNKVISLIEQQISIWGRLVIYISTAGWQFAAHGRLMLPPWRSF